MVIIYLFHFGACDNRAYVVHFQMNSILGELSVPLHSVNKRRLTCSFTVVVKRCLKRAEDQLQFHNVSFQIQQLKEQWHLLTLTRREIKLNIIDELTTDLLINTEKKCKNFRTSDVDSFTDAAKVGLIWYFWKLLLKLKLWGNPF